MARQLLTWVFYAMRDGQVRDLAAAVVGVAVAGAGAAWGRAAQAVAGVARCGRDRCGCWWLQLPVTVSRRAWSPARPAGWTGWAASQFFGVCWNRPALP